MVDRYMKPRGFGFVTFVDRQAISKVFRDSVHEVDGKVVECKLAVPKEKGFTVSTKPQIVSPIDLGKKHVSLGIAKSPSLHSQPRMPKNFQQNPHEKATYEYQQVKKAPPNQAPNFYMSPYLKQSPQNEHVTRNQDPVEPEVSKVWRVKEAERSSPINTAHHLEDPDPHN